MKVRIALLFFLALIPCALTFSGSTGKIAGVVKDSQTGEPLVGANIVLEGTTMGAAADLDGYYVILNVQPGKYNLIVSALGYHKQTITGVSVSIDQTTAMDFQLQSTVVELKQEVVIVAERPLVQRDQTAKTAVVGGDDIKALPVTEVGQVLSLQAGMVAGSLRGGRSGEVAYWIDGVPITDAFNGSQVVEINKSMVQELQLISGAFNAEYGQAMSGIVNIATREGGQKFSGGAGVYVGQYVVSDEKTYAKTLDGRDSLTSELFPGLNKFTPTAIRNIEANLSGPLIGEDLTFFANGRYIYFDGDLKGFRRFNPSNVAYSDSAGVFHLYRDASGKGDSSAVSLNNSERYYGQGKLTWRLSPLIKLTGNYIYDYTKSKPYNNDNRDNRFYFYNPNGLGNDYSYSQTFIFQLSHTLNPTTFYTLGGSHFKKDFKHYLYEKTDDPRYVNPQLLVRQDGYSFYTGGTDMKNFSRSTLTDLGKFDISNQYNEMNLFKVGVEFQRHELHFDDVTLQPVQGQTAFNPAKDNPYIQTQILPTSAPTHNKYSHFPYA
ncbi:MAG: TonB-dependent receptor, partial [Bacteroidota bacterium]|nr:TonB-dependent receptor [Bacteroidota bacterium]